MFPVDIGLKASGPRPIERLRFLAKDVNLEPDPKRPPLKHGYHRATIPKGELGEISKIKEELDEVMDAEQQGNKIMVILELSDLWGAMTAWVLKRGLMSDLMELKIGDVTAADLTALCKACPDSLSTSVLWSIRMMMAIIHNYVKQFGLASRDLNVMAMATARAFEIGERKA